MMNNQAIKASSPSYQTAKRIKKTAVFSYLTWLFLGVVILAAVINGTDGMFWYCMIAGFLFSLMVLLSIFNNGDKVLWKLSIVCGIALAFSSTLIIGNMTYAFSSAGFIYSVLSIGTYWLLYWAFYSKIVLIQNNNPVSLNQWHFPRFMHYLLGSKRSFMEEDKQ